MPRSELNNVDRPVSATVASLTTGGGDWPGAGLIEFRVPRHVVEGARLGETWILSRRTLEETP